MIAENRQPPHQEDPLDSSQNQRHQEFDIESYLKREKGIDLLDVDPQTLSLRERIRQRRQREQRVREQKQLVLYKDPIDSQSIPKNGLSSDADSSTDFGEADREINTPESDFTREDKITYLPISETVIALNGHPHTESSPPLVTDTMNVETHPAQKPHPNSNNPARSQTNRSKKLISSPDPEHLAQGYVLLSKAVPPEDYHAIRQSKRYGDLLLRDSGNRILIKETDIPEVLSRRNERESGTELTPEHRLLHSFGRTHDEKVALQEAANHRRIPAIRKKDGWYATAEIAEAFLKTRRLPSEKHRPMTRQEAVRYRDYLKAGTFSAVKIKNRWHTTDEAIAEFEAANPSKRRY